MRPHIGHATNLAHPMFVVPRLVNPHDHPHLGVDPLDP